MSTNKLVCFHCNEPIEGECISLDNHIFHVGCARKYENNKNGRIYFRSFNCEICDGHGYTKKPLKPIIKIVGWEDEETDS